MRNTKPSRQSTNYRKLQSTLALCHDSEPVIFRRAGYQTFGCNGNIEMTPLCKVDVTLAGFEEPRGCAVPVVSMSKKEFDRLKKLQRPVQAQAGRQ
jgi:hypothetical protein